MEEVQDIIDELKEKKPKKKSRLVPTLIIVIFLLLGVVVYSSIIIPSFNEYIYNIKLLTQEEVINSILYHINEKGFVTISNENQSIILIEYLGETNG